MLGVTPIYQAIADLLEATGAFQSVRLAMVKHDVTTAEDYPRAVIRPRTWETLDDFDPVDTQRVEQFEVEVWTRSETGQGTLADFAQLEQLAQVVARALNFVSLAGTLPGQTRIKSGKYHEPYPDCCQVLSGQFTVMGSTLDAEG